MHRPPRAAVWKESTGKREQTQGGESTTRQETRYPQGHPASAIKRPPNVGRLLIADAKSTQPIVGARPYRPIPLRCGDRLWCNCGALGGARSHDFPLSRRAFFPLNYRLTKGKGPGDLAYRPALIVTRFPHLGESAVVVANSSHQPQIPQPVIGSRLRLRDSQFRVDSRGEDWGRGGGLATEGD